MKSLLLTLFAMLALFAIPASLSAASINPPLDNNRQNVIRTNIIAGLEHPSAEIRASYMQLVIDLNRAYPEHDFGYAIIPLMSILKNDESCPMRMLAALALYEYEDSRMSRFAVLQTFYHCDIDRLSRHCKTLVLKWHDRDDRPMYTAEVVYPF